MATQGFFRDEKYNIIHRVKTARIQIPEALEKIFSFKNYCIQNYPVFKFSLILSKA